jgi:hypothetical protein
MRVFAIIAALVLSLVTGAATIEVAAAPPAWSLQEGTPTPEVAAPGGVEVTRLGGTEQNALELFRTVIAPGSEVPSHEHFGMSLLYIESGSITFTVYDRTMMASCAGGCFPGGTPTASDITTLQAGDEVVLNAGDWVQQIDTSTHGFRNDGDVDAVLLVAGDRGANNGAGACLGAC